MRTWSDESGTWSDENGNWSDENGTWSDENPKIFWAGIGALRTAYAEPRPRIESAVLAEASMSILAANTN